MNVMSKWNRRKTECVVRKSHMYSVSMPFRNSAFESLRDTVSIARRFNAGSRGGIRQSPGGKAEIRFRSRAFFRPFGTRVLPGLNAAWKRWAILECPSGTDGHRKSRKGLVLEPNSEVERHGQSRGVRRSAAFTPLQRSPTGEVRTRQTLRTLKRRKRRAPSASSLIRRLSISEFGLISHMNRFGFSKLNVCFGFVNEKPNCHHCRHERNHADVQTV